jgi:hypothetical protein
MVSAVTEPSVLRDTRAAYDAGHVTAHLHALGLAAFGIDLSPEMIARSPSDGRLTASRNCCARPGSPRSPGCCASLTKTSGSNRRTCWFANPGALIAPRRIPGPSSRRQLSTAPGLRDGVLRSVLPIRGSAGDSVGQRCYGPCVRTPVTAWWRPL